MLTLNWATFPTVFAVLWLQEITFLQKGFVDFSFAYFKQEVAELFILFEFLQDLSKSLLAFFKELIEVEGSLQNRIVICSLWIFSCVGLDKMFVWLQTVLGYNNENFNFILSLSYLNRLRLIGYLIVKLSNVIFVKWAYFGFLIIFFITWVNRIFLR